MVQDKDGKCRVSVILNVLERGDSPASHSPRLTSPYLLLAGSSEPGQRVWQPCLPHSALQTSLLAVGTVGAWHLSHVASLALTVTTSDIASDLSTATTRTQASLSDLRGSCKKSANGLCDSISPFRDAAKGTFQEVPEMEPPACLTSQNQ